MGWTAGVYHLAGLLPRLSHVNKEAQVPLYLVCLYLKNELLSLIFDRHQSVCHRSSTARLVVLPYAYSPTRKLHSACSTLLLYKLYRLEVTALYQQHHWQCLAVPCCCGSCCLTFRSPYRICPEDLLHPLILSTHIYIEDIHVSARPRKGIFVKELRNELAEFYIGPPPPPLSLLLLPQVRTIEGLQEQACRIALDSRCFAARRGAEQKPTKEPMNGAVSAQGGRMTVANSSRSTTPISATTAAMATMTTTTMPNTVRDTGTWQQQRR